MPINLESLVQSMDDISNKEDVSIYLEAIDSPSELSNHFIWNPDASYHPASMLKLFLSLMAKEMFLDSDEHYGLKANLDIKKENVLQSIEDSLRVSDNDALGYLVDIVSNTSSGPELKTEALEIFKDKRNGITKYFSDKGYSSKLSIPNKCFSFGPCGRDQQLASLAKNTISLMDVVKVMKEIRACGDSINENIFDFMKRNLGADLEGLPGFSDASENLSSDSDEPNYQSKFIGLASLDEELKDKIDNDYFYSKAGWNSRVRHDAAFLKLRHNGSSQKYLLVILTKNLSEQAALIAKISNRILKEVLV